MSKPPTGIESLERQLRLHELRLTKLRAWRSAVLAALSKCEGTEESQGKSMDKPDPRTLVYERDTLEREIQAHETLLALGRDRQALELLDRVAHDPALAREAAPDPKAFAAAHGIRLPRNLVVRVKVASARATIQVDYIERGCTASLTFP